MLSTNFEASNQKQGSPGCRCPRRPGSFEALVPVPQVEWTSLFSSIVFVVGGQASEIQSRNLRRKQGIWKSRTARTSTSCRGLIRRAIGFWVWLSFIRIRSFIEIFDFSSSHETPPFVHEFFGTRYFGSRTIGCTFRGFSVKIFHVIKTTHWYSLVLGWIREISKFHNCCEISEKSANLWFFQFFLQMAFLSFHDGYSHDWFKKSYKSMNPNQL